MKTFYDETDQLTWINFNNNDKLENNPRYKELIEQLNSWQGDKNIEKYVTDHPLGNDMDFWFKLVQSTDLFLGINNKDEVVSCVMISHNRPLMNENELIKYIVNNHHKKRITIKDIPEEKYLDEPDTINLLVNADEKNIYIEYIIVNPKYQGRGIATRFYKTIQDNIEFFSGSNNTHLIQLSINHENIASRKAVIKNNFKRMKPHNSADFIYATYYLNLRPHKIPNLQKDIQEDEKF